MTRKRNKENKGLPEGWRLKNGAYRYRPKKGTESFWDNQKEFTLGAKLSDAYIIWSNRLKDQKEAKTIGQLLDRYALQEIPKKAPRTQIENNSNIKRVRAVFGDMFIATLTPQDIYKYFDKRTAKTQARHEIALLSHAFTKAVAWGYITRHPFKGEVELEGSKPRVRYVTDEEIIACMSLEPKRDGDSTRMIQAYIELKILTGLRQGDMLRLRMNDIKDDGIYVTPSKTQGSTGKAIIIKWTSDLKKAVDAVKSIRPLLFTQWLFCNRRGECYINEHGIAEGFKSSWQRFMDRLLQDKLIVERFTEHDLRAKNASDSVTVEEAQRRLGHSDSKITSKVYRRKAEVVEPLR